MTFHCPNCANAYQVDEHYLLQYGGLTTTCSACAAQMTLPTLADLTRASAGGVPPPLPVAESGSVLGYANPYAQGAWSQPSTPLWREGKSVVLMTGTEFPEVCVKCGMAGNKRFRRTFYWHEPTIYLLILLSPLIYIIVALIARKSGKASYSLCEIHATKRRNGMAVGWAIAAAGVASLLGAGLGVMDEVGPLVALGLVGLLVGLVVALMSARTLTPKRIRDRYLWLTGTGRAFRDQLPVGRT